MIIESEFKNKVNLIHSQIDTLKEIIVDLKNELEKIDKTTEEYKNAQQTIEEVNVKIEESYKQKSELKKEYYSQPTIKFHAKVRYLERVKGIDIKFDGNKEERNFQLLNYANQTLGYDNDKFMVEILNDDRIKLCKSLGNCTFPISEHFKAVVVDNAIISIVPHARGKIKRYTGKHHASKKYKENKVRMGVTYDE